MTDIDTLLTKHCNSVGVDKQGLTNCKACPTIIRAECYENNRPTPQGYQSIAEHKHRIATVIINLENLND